jgi:hypothetical protein
MRLTSRKTTSWVAASAAVLALLLPLVPAAAQQAGREQGVSPVTTIDAGGAGPDFDLRTVAHGFALFGSGDGAVSGLRMTGRMGAALTNYGDCDNAYSIYQCQSSRQVYVPARGGWYAPFLEVEWAVAAPPTEYLKIQQVAPSIGNATGDGWTGGTSTRILGRPPRFGPADNTLGTMFSGVTTTMDGSCRDHSGFANGYWAAGYQLLPTSDCPETWGSDGWQGAHPIEQAGWQALFDARGDGFRFDFWRVPPGDQRLDRPFLGTRFHTYGETSDYSSDVLPNYGAVVPGGVGQPAIQGYPLGLLLHFDAFTFADPRVSDAYFVRVLIINRSQDVWGTGIDYDSLYLGFSNGTLFGNSNNSRYALPDRGLVLYHGSNVQGPGGPCDDPARRPDGNGCTGSASAYRGYGPGALAIIMLKSPLGDLRNKLFTRKPGGTPCAAGQDPFCRPSHPLAGDTLTFNRQAFGNYSSAYNYTFGTGAKATLGYMAASEDLTNAGRDPASYNDNTLWTVFRSEDWTTNKVHYNKYVPPASPPWDYNHDGVPDTLALDTCGRSGCAALDSDTMPGGWLNRRGNIGGLQSFGPFALAAGDTTALVYAMVGDGDSTALWAQIDAVTDLYLDLFATAEPPPPARVVSTEVTPGTDALGTQAPAVRLRFSDDPVRWVDPYLMKLADDVAGAVPGTTLGQLRDLNDGGTITIITVDTLPGPVYDTTVTVLRSTNLVSALRERAAANLERLEIYKSCDDGRSYTSDADCLGNPATDADGHPVLQAWEPYAILRRDTTQWPNTFTDADVQAGRTYRYALVAKSRGATFVMNTPDGMQPVTFAPALRNPLPQSTSEPNLVAVYVPASRPAGYRAAQASFTGRPEGSTVPFVVDPTDAAVGGSYQAIFGNQIVVVRDSLVSLGAATRSTVTVRRGRRVWLGSAYADSTIETHVFPYPHAERFPVAGTPTGDSTAILGDTVRTTAWYYALGFLVVGPSGPIFASRNLVGAQATSSAVFTAPGFAGFSIAADNTLSNAFNPDGEQQVRGALSLAAAGLGPADTVVDRTLVDQSMVQWREDVARRPRLADGTGRYSVSWLDDPFGLSAGLTFDPANRAATQAALLAALDARATAAVAPTDAETATLIGVAQTDLLPARLPFTVRNVTFDRPVTVAVLRGVDSLIVLGSGGDTVSVAIPADAWMPSDGLAFVEDIAEDSTYNGLLVLDSLGHPIRHVRRAVTFSGASLGCATPRASCNPLREGEPGATGYTPMHDGDRTEFEYYAGFPETGAFSFDITAAVVGSAITSVTDSALTLIRVVPNPFVLYSTYQTSQEQGRVVFTHLPPVGTLRIYTVAGQLVQQITWVPADLEGDGDLYWDLTTRGGLDVASGLYLWVLTAPSDPTNPQSKPLHARGKFVIIR